MLFSVLCCFAAGSCAAAHVFPSARAPHPPARAPRPPCFCCPPPPCLPACLLRSDSLWEDYKLAKFVPFNPTDKFTIAFVQDVKTGVIERVMKGAPQVGGWVRRVGGRAGGQGVWRQQGTIFVRALMAGSYGQ